MRSDGSRQLAALRRELERIDDEVPLPAQDRAIERLRRTHPHSITLIESADGSLGPHAYNCAMHAFDLCDLDEALLNLEKKVGQLDIGSAFMRDLVTGGLEEILDVNAGEGSVAIYFRGDVQVHAGLVVQDRFVRSKWGMGHLWQHGLFEVPAEYGDEVRFFRRLDRDEIVALFTSHVERLIQARAESSDRP